MSPSVAVAIIAGGQSSRFGDEPKATAKLEGKCLIEHVYSRLNSQSSHIWINYGSRFTVPLSLQHLLKIEDAVINQTGPLNAVLSALRMTAEQGIDWLLIAPCDTPFLPNNLIAKLLAHALNNQHQMCIPSYQNFKHPSLSLWHSSLLSSLEKAVSNEGAQGFKQFYPDTQHGFVEWADQGYHQNYDPFFNINRQSDLDTAKQIIHDNPDLKDS